MVTKEPGTRPGMGWGGRGAGVEANAEKLYLKIFRRLLTGHASGMSRLVFASSPFTEDRSINYGIIPR